MLSQMSAELTIFARLVRRPDEEIDLVQAALLIAEGDYPGLDLHHYKERLEALGRAASTRFSLSAATEERVRAVTRYLYGELGFRGNQADYYDPRNSFLNEVIERRTGIPITLALVLLEVLRYAGVTAHGVGFPGHFLVRAEAPSGPLFLDPFDGRLLGRDDLRALLSRATGDGSDPSPSLLAPATRTQILVRMLSNLRGIYSGRADPDRLLGVLERLSVLAPSEELRRQLEQLGGSRPWPSGGERIPN
jgi:regulator of sirC expression with transglutaminase-like and TPR domain